MNIKKIIKKYEKKIINQIESGRAEAMIQNVEVANKHFSKVKQYEKFIKILKKIKG